MTHAIRFEQTGGPEVLQWVAVDVPPPGPGEVSLRHTAVGLNYIDTYHRSGLYPVELPSGLGVEAAGVVTALGPGVDHLAVGDRVAYAGGPLGAYAEARTMPAAPLVKLPDAVGDEVAAAMMLQGLTAQYLLRQTYVVKPGDTILVHAAAGGVGLLLCQWAKHLGATVIGTVGSAEKATLARAHGCDHTILYREEPFAERVRELTGGQGVPVVYDAVGKDTFMDSLACLRPMGLMVSFGNASGAVPPVDLGLLAKMGSLFVTRPTLFTYAAERERLDQMAAELFDVVGRGIVKVEINQRYALAEAAQAHRDLEARRTTGSTVLVVA
ncbi:quinone oxidoreductase [Nitrogeniibacter mangrovi]|uniref:Quinone oxidoreductase n=1 Tax=Nitrogeniibacter mangrovi TaxID=2016596 RepID=A0A6C1B9J8_9RHOO|nr:quinone oxidoreductase [Nitrogeniibacter mangrovi]QID18924.1 quinone oxidoreductase [Nitrogeniibacter mangrovi]